jgi:hypothetical protein
MSRYLDGFEEGAKVKFKELEDENFQLKIKLERAIAGIKRMRDGSDAMCLITARELLEYLEGK